MRTHVENLKPGTTVKRDRDGTEDGVTETVAHVGPTADHRWEVTYETGLVEYFDQGEMVPGVQKKRARD